MPRYDYLCTACGSLFERKPSFEELIEESWCETTQTVAKVQRVINMAPMVHYKGYGFYATDHRDEQEKYAFDHFDGSGSNPEIKARERRVKDPGSTV